MSQMRSAAMRESRDIEWLVNWTLEKQGLAGELLGDSGGGGGALGVKVDGGGYSSDGRWVHADAEIIAQQIAAMSRDRRLEPAIGLVVHYGRCGRRPDWGAEGSGSWVPVRRNDGEGPIRRRYRDQRRGVGLLGFEWEWTGLRPEDLDRMMIEWLAWHAALCDLRDAINPRMTHYVATGPAVPEAPWDMPAGRTVQLPGGRLVTVG